MEFKSVNADFREDLHQKRANDGTRTRDLLITNPAVFMVLSGCYRGNYVFWCPLTTPKIPQNHAITAINCNEKWDADFSEFMGVDSKLRRTAALS